MPPGQSVRQIGIKQVEDSHVCGISMFSASGDQIIQTLEDQGKNQLTVTPGYWKHFRVKDTEVILGIHGIV
jgi:CTP:phosphocholine cytidylyltransferase-like protein